MRKSLERIFKIALSGKKGVGKTTYISSFRKQSDGVCGIGGIKIERINKCVQGRCIETQIFDSPFNKGKINDTLFLSTKGSLVFFDITDNESFQYLPKIIGDGMLKTKRRLALVIVGNKSDLRDQRDSQITVATAKSFAYSLSWLLGIKVPYVETSMELGTNADQLLDEISHGIFALQNTLHLENEELYKRVLQNKNNNKCISSYDQVIATQNISDVNFLYKIIDSDYDDITKLLTIKQLLKLGHTSFDKISKENLSRFINNILDFIQVRNKEFENNIFESAYSLFSAISLELIEDEIILQRIAQQHNNEIIRMNAIAKLGKNSTGFLQTLAEDNKSEFIRYIAALKLDLLDSLTDITDNAHIMKSGTPNNYIYRGGIGYLLLSEAQVITTESKLNDLERFNELIEKLNEDFPGPLEDPLNLEGHRLLTLDNLKKNINDKNQAIDVRITALSLWENIDDNILEKIIIRKDHTEMKIAALSCINNLEFIQNIVLDDQYDPNFRITAISLIEDKDTLQKLVKFDTNEKIRELSIKKIKDNEILLDIIFSQDETISNKLVAYDRIDDPKILKKVKKVANTDFLHAMRTRYQE